MTTWTPEMIATLRKLHAEGIPFSQSADSISRTHGTYVTRNAAIGKAKRLGMLNEKPGYAPSPKPGKTPKLNSGNIRKKALARQREEKREVVLPDQTPSLPTVAPIRFGDLTRGECSWCIEPPLSPSGPDMMCCGAPVVDKYAPEGNRKATHCHHHFDAGRSIRVLAG